MPSYGGNLPLHAAFQSNVVNLITMLIQHNADLNATNAEGHTPVHYGNLTTLKELNMCDLVASRSTPFLNNNNIHQPQHRQVDVCWKEGAEFQSQKLLRSDSMGEPGRPRSYHPPKR